MLRGTQTKGSKQLIDKNGRKTNMDIFRCRDLSRATHKVNLLDLAKEAVKNCSEEDTPLINLIGAIAAKKSVRPRARLTPKKWALLAVSTDSSRQSIANAYVQDGKLTATDGHRLHQLIDKKLENGWLNKKGQHASSTLDFPPMDQLLPKSGECCYKLEITDFKPHSLDSFGETWALVVQNGSKAKFNAQYIQDAFGDDTCMYSTPLRDVTQMDPLKLESMDHRRKACVMPMRPDEKC